NNTDTFEILVEMLPEDFSDTPKVITKKEKKLQSAMKEMLGINPTIRLVAPKSIARSEGKAVRVIDNRKKLGINVIKPSYRITIKAKGVKTMAIKQLSIFVENREGTLVTVTDAIAKAGVDIRAMSVADTNDFGIFRLIVTDVDKAKQALDDAGAFVSVTEVVGVAVQDEPGALAKVVKILADNNINIEYMYAFITVSKQFAYVVLRVEDNAAAEKILKENGISLVTEDDMNKL
ncbi:MAG: ACT domain-containing protein, partial [Ruminococcus sp.]|nr:ACT domain-containing protein [Ruminococcus sp.]